MENLPNIVCNTDATNNTLQEKNLEIATASSLCNDEPNDATDENDTTAKDFSNDLSTHGIKQ